VASQTRLEPAASRTGRKATRVNFPFPVSVGYRRIIGAVGLDADKDLKRVSRMPIYEYLCRECGHQFEWLVRNNEKPSCPSCGRGKLTKQLSVPAAHTAATGEAPCPAREDGSCGVSDCCGNRCGLSEWR